MEDCKGGEVGEESHSSKLAEGPFPGVGFTFYHCGGGETLEGVDVKDEKRKNGQRCEQGRAVGFFGGGKAVAEFVFSAVGLFIDCVGDRERGHEDFAGGEGGEHGGSGA